MKKHGLSFKVPSNMTKYTEDQQRPQILEFQATFMALVASGVYDPEMIINADQSPCNRAVAPGRVIGRKGIRTYVRAVSGDKARVTAMFAVPLRGPFLCPFLVNRHLNPAKAAKVVHHRFAAPEKYSAFNEPITPEDTTELQLTRALSPASAPSTTAPGNVVFQPFPLDLVALTSPGLSTSSQNPARNTGPTRVTRHQLSLTGAPGPLFSSSPVNEELSRVIHTQERSGTSRSRSSLKTRPKKRGRSRVPRAKTTDSPIAGHRTRNADAYQDENTLRRSKRVKKATIPYTVDGPCGSDDDEYDPGSESDSPSEDDIPCADSDYMPDTSDDDASGLDYESDYSEEEPDDEEAPKKSGRGFSSHPEIQKFLEDTQFREMPIEAQLAHLERLTQEYRAYLDRSSRASPNPSGDSPNGISPLRSVFVTANPKAWFNSAVMVAWIREVVLPHRKDPNKRILLLIDCCSLHRTQEVREFCLAHNVDVLFIPPNCTAFLQPLDIGINRIMKDHLRKFTVGRIFYEIDENGRRAHDARYLTEHRYQCALLSFLNQISRETISNSFRHMVEGSRGAPATAPSEVR